MFTNTSSINIVKVNDIQQKKPDGVFFQKIQFMICHIKNQPLSIKKICHLIPVCIIMLTNASFHIDT